MDDTRLIRAVLFDIDGTLIDSNYLHVDAWARAFDEVGAPVDSWRIHRSIGMDSTKLLSSLLGERADELGDAAKDGHREHYLSSAPRLRAFEGAADLLRAVSARGVEVVLATSSPEDELEILLPALGADDAIKAVTSSADVDTAKPEPDLIGVALERAGVDAAEAVLIGDSVYDIEAAARAGVRAIGVRSGGVADAELREAGAIAVYDDCTALLDALDEVLAS